MINRCRSVHGDKYDYSLVKYIRAKDKVKIICRLHGAFNQTPDKHLNGQGCPKCSSIEGGKKQRKTSAASFIERAVLVHGDKYDYSLTKYIAADKKINIICRIHGKFERLPVCHLQGRGCQSCCIPFDRSKPATIYVMKSASMVKIGITVNCKKRNSELNRVQPFRSIIAATYDMPDFNTAYKIEQRVHDKLNHLNANLSGFDGSTEWFFISAAEACKIIEVSAKEADQLPLKF